MNSVYCKKLLQTLISNTTFSSKKLYLQFNKSRYLPLPSKQTILVFEQSSIFNFKIFNFDTWNLIYSSRSNQTKSQSPETKYTSIDLFAYDFISYSLPTHIISYAQDRM